MLFVEQPTENKQEMWGSVPLHTAQELDVIWKRGQPISEPYQAWQAVEDTAKVILAATLACSDSLEHKNVPRMVEASIHPDIQVPRSSAT